MLLLFLRYYLIQVQVVQRLALATSEAKTITNAFEVFSGDRIRVLNDLAILWPDRDPNLLDWFHTQAANMRKVHTDIADIGWINSEFTVRRPFASREHVLVLDKNITEFGINTDELKLIGQASSLYQANNSLVFFVIRIDPDNPQLGYLLASFDLEKTLSLMMGDLINQKFNFSINDSKTSLLEHSDFADDESVVYQSFNFAGRTWMLKLQYADTYLKIDNMMFWLASIVSGFAILFLYWLLLINAFRPSKNQLYHQAASEASLDGILVYEALIEKNCDITEFVLVDANKAAIKILDITLPATQPIKLSHQLQLIQAQNILHNITDVNQSGLPFEYELHIHSSNINQWFKLQVVKAGDGVALTFRDVSQHLLSHQNLQRSETKFRRLIDGLNDHYIYSKDVSGQYTFISHSIKNILGYEIADFQKNYNNYLISLPKKVEDLCLSQQQGERSQSYTVVYLAKSQQEVVIEYHDSPVYDGSGNLIAIEGIGRDVTADLILKEQIYYQANHDKITGLLNRHAFEFELQTLITQMKTTKKHATLCYIDIDEFKIINDSCGHHTGDQLLHNISNLLAQKLYCDDVIARVGGDEFCMILWDVDNKSVELRVQTVIDQVAAYRFVWEEKVFHVSVSIGLVHVEAGASDAVSLVQEADLACYQAKSNGKNQFCVYESSGLQESFRKQELDILELLQFAIEHNKLQLYFQTIKPLGSSSTNHNYEVLLRMFDKNGAMISPSVFIPVAERNGLMSRVDTWVFEHTINLLERHPKHTLLLDKCAINLSGASLNSPSLLSTILQRLQETTVPLNKLCFEITETAAVMNLVTASKMIDKIRLLGCQFALDDFGAGMSSFTYLKNMNVDYVKIDGSFVKNMSKDICDFATVKAIHEIARSMGKQTIAEFVGDEETEQLLRQLGVDFAQGFSIAHPMPMLPMLSQN